MDEKTIKSSLFASCIQTRTEIGSEKVSKITESNLFRWIIYMNK
jgi:hypothetical protein